MREGAAEAVQIVGETDPARFLALIMDWAEDPSHWVRRAAIAAICEPRLLKSAVVTTNLTKARLRRLLTG